MKALREAQREPVEILSHGSSAAVLISSHEHARLKALDRRVVLAGDFDEETDNQLRAAEAPANQGGQVRPRGRLIGEHSHGLMPAYLFKRVKEQLFENYRKGLDVIFRPEN